MESKPERPPSPPRKQSEKRPAPANNAIWYLLGAGLLVLLVVVSWRTGREEEIAYSDLKRLVEASRADVPQEERYIDIQVGVGDNKRTIRYSDLANVVIHPYKVTGTITRKDFRPPQAAAAPGDERAESAGPAAEGPAADSPAEQADESERASAETPSAAPEGGTGVAAAPTDAAAAEESPADAPSADAGQAAAIAGADQDQELVPGEPIRNLPFTTDRQSEETLLAERLDAGGVPFDYARGPSAWRNYIVPLVMMALIVLIFFMMMRRLGGAGSPMAFGRSRGKLYAQEDVEIMFDDVAGIEEAVEEVREVVEFLRTPEKYQKLGGRIPKGVLLVGPPGTGKTLLGKAIAGEAGVPFFSLSGSDFVEMFVGVGAARVRDMFQQAEAKAPCILFIDELDALGKTRGSGAMGGHDEREQTLNALLVEMDGFDSNSGVIVLAATNRPETLDPALLRPGRFDRHVLVDRPDVKGREQILQVHLRNVKVNSVVDVKQIAAITSGFVGADLANLVNEAALLAARKGKTSVGMQEFNEGVERVTAGLEKKQRIMHDDEKQRVAYHEAGHALVAYVLPDADPVHKVSIIPRGLAALGYTMQRPEQDRFLMTKGELTARIQVLLAGTIAEEMIFDDVSTGAQNDLERASEIGRSMVMDFGMSRLGRVTYRESGRSPFLATSGDGNARLHSHSEQTAREIDEEVKHIVDESIERVRQILQSHKKALVAMSELLLHQEVIDADELRTIMEEHSPSPRIVPGTAVEPKRGQPADFDSSDMIADVEQAEGG